MFQRKDTYTIPEGAREEAHAQWSSKGYHGFLDAHPESYISPDCQIVGNVKLEYRAIVMRGAVLRADSDRIEIGAESNVQENCVLHESRGYPLVIGEHTTIGHGAILHGCQVGDNSMVGMGAVLLDGAKVGNNAVVAAGALLLEGQEVPDFHMALGVPAKVRGPFPEEKILGIVTSFTEVNLVEAEHMLEAGILEHPSEELFRKIDALPKTAQEGSDPS